MGHQKRQLERITGQRRLLETLMLTLTPEMIIKKLKKPENKNPYAVFAKLVKELGELSSHNQMLITTYLFDDGDDELEKLKEIHELILTSQSVKDCWNMDDSIINELCKMFLNVDACWEVDDYAQIRFIRHRIIVDFIGGFIYEDITKMFGFRENFTFEIGSQKVIDPDSMTLADTVDVEYISDDSHFWLVYDALLDDEEAVEEGCKLFKQLKMELALDGYPVKFEEEKKDEIQ